MQNEVITPKKERKKLKLNLIDAVIIISLIIAAVGVYVRYDLSGMWRESSQTVNAAITFSVSNIQAESANYFVEGAEVYNCDAANNLIGTLAGLDEFVIEPAVFYVDNGKGAFEEVYSTQDRIDVTGVINAPGVMTENGFLYGGTTYIAPGQTVTVETKDLLIVILITNIETE